MQFKSFYIGLASMGIKIGIKTLWYINRFFSLSLSLSLFF